MKLKLFPSHSYSAIKSLIGTGLALTLVPHSIAQSSDDESDSPQFEEVVITGSRIKRSEFTGSGQVIGIDQEAIQLTGALTVADVLRSSPLNSYGSFNERSGSSAQSNATVNLRGLEEERSLVMIDGRRMVGSPNLGASTININMVPMAAVESIEVLADGASAVYGSDAVAGVVNMQMYKDFEGLKFNFRYGDRSEDDGGEVSASILGGISGARSNITFAIETNRRDPIFDADREYTASWTRDNNGNGVIDAYVDTDGYSIYGKSIWLYDASTDYDRIQAATSCAPGNGFLGEVDADIDWGYDSDLNENSYCMYDYAAVSANKAELDRINSYIYMDYELTDDIEFYSNTIISKVDSFGRFAPPAATWDDMPADYSDVPFDIDALLAAGDISEDYSLTGFYRWTNIGNRDNFVTDLQMDFTNGLRGDITDNVSFEAYVQKSNYTSKEYGKYYLSYTGLDFVVNNGLDPFSESGSAAMSAITTQDNESDMLRSYGHIQFGAGDLFDAGEILVLTGMEYTVLEYDNRYDRASEFGYVGGSAGNSSSGERDIFAFFGEAVIPFSRAIEANVALRYDHYDDFGEEISPTVSVNWAVNDDLSLRTRWGQGFRAPGLDQLWGPQTFSAESASDQLNCAQNNIAPQDCGSSQFDTYFSTNPNLGAEHSDSISLGVNWRPYSSVELDISYWDIKIDDVIVEPTTQEIFYAEAAGYNFDPSTGNYVDRQGGRAIVYSSYTNQGELSSSGIDFQLNTINDIGPGALMTHLFIVRTLSYKQSAYFGGPTQETNGFNLQPKIKGQFTVSYEIGNHLIEGLIDYVGESSDQDFIEFDSSGNAFLATSSEKLDTWTTANLSYSYDTQNFGKFKVGARNITNEEPVLDRNGKYDVLHYDLYDNTGRVVYFDYTLQL